MFSSEVASLMINDITFSHRYIHKGFLDKREMAMQNNVRSIFANQQKANATAL